MSPRIGIALPMVSRGLDAGELLGELVEEVQAAEEAGLDHCMVPEHHAGPPGSLSDPLTVAGWILARTSTIRVATGILILPLHNPVLVAERAALLQHASGGRLVLGVGAGYQAEDYATFGVAIADRVRLLEAGIQTLRSCWRGEPVAGSPLIPGLPADLAPPLWLGAWSDRGTTRAAAMADGWIADPIRTFDEVVEASARYRAELQRLDRAGSVVVMREGWVDESDERAREVYGPAIGPVYQYYLRNGAFPADSGITPEDLRFGAAYDERLVCGSAETVADRLAAFMRATGARTCTLAMRHPGGPGHEQVLRAIRRLGEDVLPRVRALLAKEGAGR